MTATTSLGPWPHLAAARSFLAILVERELAHQGVEATPSPWPQHLPDARLLAGWLVEQGLGPLALARIGPDWPELAEYLQPDTYSAVAEQALHADSLKRIARAFTAAEIPAVLLKGAALARTIYSDPRLRTMSDVDLWLRKADMPRAVAQMSSLGFCSTSSEIRPPALQAQAGGEIQFRRPEWRSGLVELHYSCLAGWWLQRTAALDDAAIWSRAEHLPELGAIRQLSSEDMVIQVAVHAAVNHQFGAATSRTLVDLALLARRRSPDWSVVARRARAWRVGTVLAIVLELVQQLVGVPGIDRALTELRPRPWRRSMLKQLVSPASVLRGDDLRGGPARLLLLILLVDRFRDMARLAARTLWPEDAWLTARYPRKTGHWHHLWRIVRSGRI